MYIGTLAKKTGVSAKAIRHYESLGLMRNIRRQGTYRVYEEHHVVIIKMIQTAQSLGFKLKDMVPLIDQKYATQRFPKDIALLAIEAKQQALHQQINEAKQTLATLDELKVSLNVMFD